jgi:hypothetical protein
MQVSAMRQIHQTDIFEFARERNIEIMRKTKGKGPPSPTISSASSVDTEYEVGEGLSLTDEQLERIRIFEEEVDQYPEATIADHGYMRLAAAIVVSAVRDAASKDPDKKREAQNWLLSKQAQFYLSFLGFDEHHLQRWFDNGRPTKITQAHKIYGTE